MSSYVKLGDKYVHLLGNCTTIFLSDESAFVSVNVATDKNVKSSWNKITYIGNSELTYKEQVVQIQFDLMKQITMLQNAVNELDQIRRTNTIL